MKLRRESVTRPRGMEFIRPPQNAYSLTFDDKRVSQMAFTEDASKTVRDVMEDMKASNAKAGRNVTYKMSKDGMSARWHMRYTNVDRVISGKLKCFAKRSA